MHPASYTSSSELMTDPNTLGPYLRRERERRGLTLRTISENTKVSVALLEGLEADDISRWPGGIFRRAFVRSYAQCIGLDPGEVYRRFERQFPVEGADGPETAEAVARGASPLREVARRHADVDPSRENRARLLGVAADLTVAAILAFGFAAAGSRLLWPVLLIACYHAVGVLLTGTSPMVALLSDGSVPLRRKAAPLLVATKPQPTVAVAAAVADERPAAVSASDAEAAALQTPRLVERRHQARRPGERQVRHRRGVQARA